MKTSTLHADLIVRKQRLEEVKCALKNEFLGLDNIIDEVMSLLMPWYLFPEAQLRPTIVNLWGLTGSGKTALVQALIDKLEYRKLYSHVDMGEFESDSASWMKNILTDDLAFFHEKSPVICLDEFQFARTLDANQQELGKDKLRVIWDLLDSGKIQYIPSTGTYYLFRADNCLKRMEKLRNVGVMLQDGVVTTGLEYFVKGFEGFYFDYNDRSDAVISGSYFISDDFINGMFNLFEDDDFSREQLRQQLKRSTFEEIVMLLKEGMQSRPASKTLDLSRSLIFVLGNLDEAYTMSHNMNPDISADEFHEATAKINVSDIKRALRKRFRPEQIARLGNNHLIYRSFSCAQFRALIRRELKRLEAFVHGKFGWILAFDESVVDIVYAEGVFPAHGTRPVFTTVKNLVESKVSHVIVSILEYQLTPAKLVWKYIDGKFTYDVLDTDHNVVLSLTDTARLQLENLRRSVDPQLQAHVAVHEAGHAVLAALTLRIVPSVVVSRTASEDEGFCLVNFPKGPVTRETLKKDIVITLGGYVAEKMIFGVDFTSTGVYLDIEGASKLANTAVRNYAMGEDPIYLALGTQNEDAFVVTARYSKEALAIVRECEAAAEQILERNKLLLLKMADYLTTHSRMEEQMIAQYVRQFAAESWVVNDGFVTKENYHQFNTVLQAKLAEATEKESATKANVLADMVMS